MSNPNIPNITPTISLSTAQTVPLLLASIALEEIALAHLINAEAEKLQFVLGTLTPTKTKFSPATVSLANLIAVNESVQRTLRDVIKKEMLLEFKFENVLDLIALSPSVKHHSHHSHHSHGSHGSAAAVTVTLSSGTDVLCSLGTGAGTTPLTGQVMVNGSPPPAGTPVSFTLSNTFISIISPNPTFTDASGSFSTTFNVNTTVPNTEMITATALGQNSNTVTIHIVDCVG